MPELLSIGQIVVLRVDPSRQGSVIQILPAVGGQPRYRVFHGPQDIREYYGDQLDAAVALAPQDQMVSALCEGRGLGREAFRAHLTSTILSNPLTDNIYALHAARIKFIPFQFKPLLRFLRSDRPRLLIADEVGVGKTIEAGLILKELKSRQKVENVLIVCPKALVSKWRAEMRRFDENFHALDAATLRYCLSQTELEGYWPAQFSQAIVHLELLRNPDYLFGIKGRHPRPGLLTLNPAPQFSLVIVDEAHHLRTPDTNAHAVARRLCDSSEAALFLSATPVQLGSRNLYTLLNLLRPDLFFSERGFDDMIRPNRFLMQAMRHVRSAAPADSWQQAAADELDQAAATRWGAQSLQHDPRFAENSQALRQDGIKSPEMRVHCLRDLEELHTLAHVMNRTRRRDIGRFTVREPRTVSVPFTPEQDEFYRDLIGFREEILLLEHDPVVVRLLLDTLERQASSCLPALIGVLAQFVRTGRFSASYVSDDMDEDEDEWELSGPLREKARSLLLAGERLAKEQDPKLEQLLQLVRVTGEGTGPGKTLIFSFFLRTLGYLHDHFKKAGYRVGLVTGQVEDDERERLRDRFRKNRSDPDALDVLLSSEVGCEGLDYEFCDRLVNYDLPWNPMRLEQRIGRIDRFGQASEMVLIFNFITPGTVEERIFYRCYERLGIFRDTIGDCEEVLGEISLTTELMTLAREPRLTPEAAEARMRQISDNALRLLEEQRRLESEGGVLLGLDQALTEEVRDVESEMRFVAPTELVALIATYLAAPELTGAISPHPDAAGLYRLRLNQEGRCTLLNELRLLGQRDRAAIEFKRWLEGSEAYLALTFDPGVALEHRSVVFVTPVHPLSRMACAKTQAEKSTLVTALRIHDKTLPAGRFLFNCQVWESRGVRSEIVMKCFAWDLERLEQAPAVAQRTLHALRLADAEPYSGKLDREMITSALQHLERAARSSQQSALAGLVARNKAMISARLAGLEVQHRARLQQLEEALRNATDEKIRIMKQAEKQGMQSDYLARQKSIQGSSTVDILVQNVAAGYLEISHD